MEAIKKVIIKRFKSNDTQRFSDFTEKDLGNLADMAS